MLPVLGYLRAVRSEPRLFGETFYFDNTPLGSRTGPRRRLAAAALRLAIEPKIRMASALIANLTVRDYPRS